MTEGPTELFIISAGSGSLGYYLRAGLLSLMTELNCQLCLRILLVQADFYQLLNENR